ncbi:CRISPR-associated endonuclease Cas2 [Alicycliphilus denitrificans]|nr:CRISPR-associated endonuclease Cas2 [Alicycliphilus denitrificans]
MVVMFDLPVVEKSERRAATGFRNALLDLGFEMSQFSVYMRFCTSQTQVDTLLLIHFQIWAISGRVHVEI